MFKTHGMIYAAYHFASGRWYVGQTINTVMQRARQHWWSRRGANDYLHLALADTPDPMGWLALPVETIPKQQWCDPGPKHANWRQRERVRFRHVATVRERWWVDKLQAMWPRGYNSQYPGRPAATWHRPPQQQGHQGHADEPARDIQAALQAVRGWQADAAATQAWLQGASREDLTELLDGLLQGLSPSEQSPISKAVAIEVKEILRKRKLEKKPRDFVRLYGNRLAASLNLPDLFMEPSIFRLHPEP